VRRARPAGGPGALVVEELEVPGLDSACQHRLLASDPGELVGAHLLRREAARRDRLTGTGGLDDELDLPTQRLAECLLQPPGVAAVAAEPLQPRPGPQGQHHAVPALPPHPGAREKKAQAARYAAPAAPR